MEWVLKLEVRNGWGEVESIEVGRLERRVMGLTAEELGLTLAESKTFDCHMRAQLVSSCSTHARRRAMRSTF